MLRRMPICISFAFVMSLAPLAYSQASCPNLAGTYACPYYDEDLEQEVIYEVEVSQEIQSGVTAYRYRVVDSSIDEVWVADGLRRSTVEQNGQAYQSFGRRFFCESGALRAERDSVASMKKDLSNPIYRFNSQTTYQLTAEGLRSDYQIQESYFEFPSGRPVKKETEGTQICPVKK